jgi:hypothetical protein
MVHELEAYRQDAQHLKFADNGGSLGAKARVEQAHC